jgi:hypothetical protein
MWPASSMITPEPSASPLLVVTWIATTEADTAADTACQSGLSLVEPDTGTESVLVCPIALMSEARVLDEPSSWNARSTPAVARLATRAVAALTPTTGSQSRRRSERTVVVPTAARGCSPSGPGCGAPSGRRKAAIGSWAGAPGCGGCGAVCCAA